MDVKRLRRKFTLKPHAVVRRIDGPTYYEVVQRPDRDGDVYVDSIDRLTGASGDVFDVVHIDLLELVAPTHPVYIKWAMRRLADTLEGLDR